MHNDFLDRFGGHLRQAQAPPASTVTTRRSRWSALTRPGRTRRIALITLAAVGVATPALAVVQPWNPTIGRPAIDGDVSTDTAPVAQPASEVLGVLRRDQTARDRELAATPLRAIGGEISQVQTASIRALRNGWVLVPANAVRTGPARAGGSQLCITNGDVVGCSPATSANATGVGVIGADNKATTLVGLVPDRVARIRFTRPNGTTTEASVASNFYDLAIPEVAPPAQVKAPEGYDGPDTIPAPPRPIEGKVEWLDAGGTVIGPESGNQR